MDKDTESESDDITHLRHGGVRDLCGGGGRACRHLQPGLSDSQFGALSLPQHSAATLPTSSQHSIVVLRSGLIIEILLIIVTVAVCNCSSRA